MAFTKKQALAYKAMKRGQNVFLSGEAGTGKSFVLNRFIDEKRNLEENILVTAPSGIAAINVTGVTIHRAFQVPLNPIISDPNKIPDVIKTCSILVVDEISMCRRDLFEYVIKTIQDENKLRIEKKMANQKRNELNSEDYYINFNYTQTLQEVYGIMDSNIYHIHGKCDFDIQLDDLIIGHGNKAEIDDLRKEIWEIKSKGDWQWDQYYYNRLAEYKCELSILEDLRKKLKL